MSAGKRLAILIGSSRFSSEPNLRDLPRVENDVDGMHSLLAASEFGAYDEVFPFKNAEHHAVLIGPLTALLYLEVGAIATSQTFRHFQSPLRWHLAHLRPLQLQ